MNQQEALDLLERTLEDVAEARGDEPCTATERMRAAVALADVKGVFKGNLPAWVRLQQIINGKAN